MATEAKRTGKTEVLSMRMDPKTRFLVDVLARLRGQSISTVVERAILEAADSAKIGEGKEVKTWRDYWNVSEGVRALNLASEEYLYPSYDDEYKVEFAKIHWPFFYSSASAKYPKEYYVDILWPRIDEFLEIWNDTKSTNYFAAGRVMQKAISDANVRAPDWPIKAPEKSPEKPVATTTQGAGGGPSWDAPKGGDLDDEIPF